VKCPRIEKSSREFGNKLSRALQGLSESSGSSSYGLCFRGDQRFSEARLSHSFGFGSQKLSIRGDQSFEVGEFAHHVLRKKTKESCFSSSFVDLVLPVKFAS